MLKYPLLLLPTAQLHHTDMTRIDGTFLPWCISLQKYIEATWPLPKGLMPIPPDVVLSPKYILELVEDDKTMDTNNESIPNLDVETSEDAVPINSADYPARTATSPSSTHPEKPTTELRTDYNVDNHGRKLDREAALFSHVDYSPRQVAELKYAHQVEDWSPHALVARLSNGTAQKWPGAIDALDKPNVLKDFPTKYALNDDTDNLEHKPDFSLLPIPNAFYSVVEGNDRLTPSSHWQDVRKLKIRILGHISGSKMPTPKAGDVAVIYPKNFPQDVQALIDLMGWGDVADKQFQHVSHGLELPCRTPRNCYPLKNSTLRQLLTHNYDITCIPRRSFFTLIASYTEDSAHKERLREFADPGRSDEFWDYTSRPRRSILEVLQDFPSVQIPYEHVPAAFPTIRGREYSIANGGRQFNHALHRLDTAVELLVAMVKYKTVLRKTRHGLCSRYIASLAPGTPIHIQILRNNSMPEEVSDPVRPLLAIAPGTGVAPVRSLIHERQAAAAASGRSSQRRNTLLIYGGRNREADFFFKHEWDALDVNVITAFSRDQPYKVYVQDRLLENYQLVCNLLTQGAVVCLCGSSGKMPEAVRTALYDCMVKGELAHDRESAKTKLYEMNAFWEEVW